MIWFINNILPWIISVVTIYMTFLQGNKHKNAWLVGIGSQVLWVVWIVGSQTWGYIPLNIAMWIMYIRNHFKWRMS